MLKTEELHELKWFQRRDSRGELPCGNTIREHHYVPGSSNMPVPQKPYICDFCRETYNMEVVCDSVD